MREIQVQKLTKDNFGKYGEFLDLLDESELKKKSISVSYTHLTLPTTPYV